MASFLAPLGRFSCNQSNYGEKKKCTFSLTLATERDSVFCFVLFVRCMYF